MEFILTFNMSNRRYIPIQERINELISRGVAIDVKHGISKWNGFICSTNFTRICGYVKMLKEGNNNKISIEDVKKAYYFDSEMSHLISKIILYIEAYLRTQIIDVLCLSSMFGKNTKTPHLSADLFYDDKDQKEWWARVEEDINQRMKHADRDEYLVYCLKEYESIEKMPIWSIVEFISLDKILILIAKIRNKNIQKKLSPVLGVEQDLVYKWLLCFKELRNAIFHNTVLKNIKIKFPQGDKAPESINNENKWDDYLTPILKVISNEGIFPEEVRKIEKEVADLLNTSIKNDV